jgi:hypothetical protein
VLVIYHAEANNIICTFGDGYPPQRLHTANSMAHALALITCDKLTIIGHHHNPHAGVNWDLDGLLVGG